MSDDIQINEKYIFLLYGFKFVGKLLNIHFTDQSFFVVFDDLTKTKVWLPTSITAVQEYKEYTRPLKEEVE